MIRTSKPNKSLNMINCKYLVLLISLVLCLHEARSEEQAKSKCKQNFSQIAFLQ